MLVVQGFIFAKMIYDGRQKDKDLVRTRTWELEDRQALAVEVARKVEGTAAATATRLASSTADIAAELGQQVRTHADAVADALSAEQRRMTHQMAEDARLGLVARQKLAAQLADAETARAAADAAAVVARAQLQQTQTGIAGIIEHERRNRQAAAAGVAAAWSDTAEKLALNTELTGAVKARLDENTDLTKVVGEAAAAAYDKASERLAALDARVSGLDSKMGVTNSRIELFAGDRARTLAAEGAVHLADAERIHQALAPTPQE